jgi:hypothetical protein
MGSLPHESRSEENNNQATEPRLHHSSFVKPEVEYLATQIFSNLRCKAGEGNWSMAFVNSEKGFEKK